MAVCEFPPILGGSDDELMRRITAGDWEEPLAELQIRYRNRVQNFVQGIVKDPHLAQDVCQETLIKVFLKSHLYEVGTNFRAWLFEIARNQALSTVRSRRRNPRPISSLTALGEDEQSALLDQLIGSVSCDSSRALLEIELLEAFQVAVGELPQKYRTVFAGCAIEGRTYQELAAELDIPTGTVAIRIMRARKRLFQALAPHLGRLRRPPACAQ